MNARITGRAFFDREPTLLAPDLLGCVLTHTLPDGTVRNGRIVEVEAYMAEGDAAAHNARGRTKATNSLFMGAGSLYVHPMRQYFGIDLVAAAPGSVLLRALEPITGIERASGPGLLCRAMGIDKKLDGLNILSEGCPLSLSKGEPISPDLILASPRIGITKNAAPELRFSIKGNVHVSR